MELSKRRLNRSDFHQLHRKKKPQGYYYKDGNRWIKFYVEYEDGVKWNLFCQSLAHMVNKEDFERFIKETGIIYVESC
jgi:hypothetical protein